MEENAISQHREVQLLSLYSLYSTLERKFIQAVFKNSDYDFSNTKGMLQAHIDFNIQEDNREEGNKGEEDGIYG